MALATAGILMPAMPAFAAPAGPDTAGHAGQIAKQFGAINAEGDELEQFGVLNTEDLDVADTVTIPVCLNDTNVSVGIIVAVVADILSPSGQADSCDAGIATDNGGR